MVLTLSIISQLGRRKLTFVRLSLAENRLKSTGMDVLRKGFSVCVLGGSGNVGKEVIKSLLNNEEVSKIVMLNRREIPEFSENKKIDSVIVDLNSIEAESAKHCQACDALIITMGLGATSKHTKEVFYNIDVEIPTNCAKGARAAGVKHVSLMTAVGADAKSKESWITGTSAGGGLYNQYKGVVENNIIDLNFQTTSIYRPAGIIGNIHSPSLLSLFQQEWLGKFRSIQQTTLGNALANGCIAGIKAAGAEKLNSTPIVYEGASLFDIGEKTIKSDGGKEL